MTFGILIDDKLVYRGNENQHFPSDSSLYLLDFLSVIANFFKTYLIEIVQSKMSAFGVQTSQQAVGINSL